MAVQSSPAGVQDSRVSYVQWRAILAGAALAAGLSLVLHAFAGSIGLAVSSTAPSWRDSSLALQLLSGLYLVLAALVAFGVGGYVAGRMRTPVVGDVEEVEFQDGALGLIVWAVGIILTALLMLAAAQSLTRLAAPSTGPSGTAQSVAGENIIAFDLDRLLRAERRPQNVDLTYARSEAARILLTTTGHNGISADDRAYLVRLTAALTGLSPADAEQRVATIVDQARDNIRKARRSAVILAFMSGAAALLGAAAAWFAACAGGEHRDARSTPPSWILGRRGTIVRTRG
jgi:hypothetical protein